MPVSTQQRSGSAQDPTLTPHPRPSGEAQQRMQLPEARPRTRRSGDDTRSGSWLAGVGSRTGAGRGPSAGWRPLAEWLWCPQNPVLRPSLS